MSYENPTPLRVGMTGTLDGHRWRVAGRTVLGMEVDGETYYWHEFNLVDGFARRATLVYEETEDGAEWKLFKEFAPLRALTAAEAATKRTGQMVELDGIARRITLVDESRVYHLDGTAPEGVEVGDVAHYFNVDTGERMLVVSWTGDEIEFFSGEDLPAQKVAAAFGLGASGAAAFRRPDTASFGSNGAHERGRFQKWFPVAIGIVIFVFSVATCTNSRRSSHGSGSQARPNSAPSVPSVPPLRLATGASGTLGAQHYTVAAHAEVGVGRVNGSFSMYEYRLRTADGALALLVNRLNRGVHEWHLLRPVAPASALTPYGAATLRKNDPLVIEGKTLRVAELFQSKVRTSVPEPGAEPWPTTLEYGFVAQAAGTWLLARWTENGIAFHLGEAVNEGEVRAALGQITVEAK